MPHQLENWAHALARSTGEYTGDLSQVTSSEDEAVFYDAAECIVEPAYLTDDEYYNFIEADGDNWAQWIRTNLGADWGRVADIVNTEGY